MTPEREPLVVGVDSAELTGIAVLDGPRLVRRGTIRIGGADDVTRAVDAFLIWRPTLVVIEDCYVRPNDHTGLVLARLTGRWLQEIERRGFRAEMVLASTWQPAILNCAWTDKREARKAAAIDWALRQNGNRLPEDQADAAGLAWWGLRRLSGVRASHRTGNGPPTRPGAFRRGPPVTGATQLRDGNSGRRRPAARSCPMPQRKAFRDDSQYHFRSSAPGVRAAMSLGTAPLTDAEVAECDREEAEAAAVGLSRPRTLAECPTGPCSWAGCRFSLIAWREARYGAWKETFPGRTITDFPADETCALRVAARADRSAGDDSELGRVAALSFEELGRLHNVTIEAASRIVGGALAKLAADPESVAILAEFAAEKGRSMGEPDAT